MKLGNINDMVNGWFVGNFEPSLFKTAAFEVAHHTHKKFGPTEDHFHKHSTEINYILSGKMEVNGKTLSDGEFFILEPYEVSKARFLEDTQLIVVRTKSIPGDKHRA